MAGLHIGLRTLLASELSCPSRRCRSRLLQGATWFETGAAMLNGGTLNWFAVPIANISNPLPLFAVVAANVVLMGAVENYRRTGEDGRGLFSGPYSEL